MDCSTPGFPVFHYLWSLLKLVSLESMMPSSHLILCCPLFLLRSILPSIRVFSNESALCFYLLTFVNSAVVNTGVQISRGDPAFRSFGHIPRSGTAGSDGNSRLIFLRKHHALFLSGCTILPYHQECTGFSVPPHPPQRFLFSVFLW